MRNDFILALVRQMSQTFTYKKRKTKMGFFGKSGQSGPCAPPGTYYAVLANVEIKPMASFDNPNEKVLRAVFTYQTNTPNPEGGEYELRDMTGTNYGNDQAKLTQRLDTMFPKLSPAQRAELLPEHMIGKNFILEVTNKKKKDKDEMTAVIAFIKPFAGKELPKPQPKEDEDETGEDPFAKDE